MEYYLLGYQDLDFDTKDGKIDGISIFVAYEEENVVGKKAEKKFLSRTLINKLKLDFENMVNKKINIYCDLKGRVMLVQLAQH